MRGGVREDPSTQMSLCANLFFLCIELEILVFSPAAPSPACSLPFVCAMNWGQLASMMDLRFKSKVTEASFKKYNDESLLYKGLPAYSAWQALLFVMTCVGPYDRFCLPHIGFLLVSGLLGAVECLKQFESMTLVAKGFKTTWWINP